MNGCDFCDKRKIEQNIHFKKEPIKMGFIEDKEGAGIYIIVGVSIKAVFDILYCPMCGKYFDGNKKQSNKKELMK